MPTLAIDQGNSTLTVGWYLSGTWKHIWKWPTNTDEPDLYYASVLSNALLEEGLLTTDVRKIIISTVVPDLKPVLEALMGQLFQAPQYVLGPELYDKLPIAVPHPHEIGSDLVANALAAWLPERKASIIVDFGTALSCTLIEANGDIIGVTIAPGLHTAAQSLRGNTAQLPTVPLEMSASAIGHDTVSAIQAGILHGYVGLVRHLLAQFRAERGVHFQAIATGGLSAILHPLKEDFDRIDPLHTLEGIRQAGEFVA